MLFSRRQTREALRRNRDEVMVLEGQGGVSVEVVRWFGVSSSGREITAASDTQPLTGFDFLSFGCFEMQLSTSRRCGCTDNFLPIARNLNNTHTRARV